MASANFNYLMLETAVRIVLLIMFFISEEIPPFVRIIQPEEWWLYKNPVATHEFCNTTLLFLISLLSPIFTILIVNFCGRKKRDLTSAFLAVTLALCINGNVTNLIKIFYGRPRPDFFYRCFPNGKVPQGQPSTFNLECTGDKAFIAGGRKSFPSGHSSFVFTGLGFCAIYLAGQLRCFSAKGRGSSWRLLVAFTPLVLAACIAISRTSDYRHHWQDVLVGSIIGFVITFTCYRQHYPPLSHLECNAPYMRTDPSDLAHSKSMDKLQSVYVKRDV